MKKVIIFLIILLSLFIVLFISNRTYSILSSLTNITSETDISSFNIKVNGTTINSMDQSAININNIEFENNHASSNTLAPNSKGSFTLEIDPFDVDVAFYFELTGIDHVSDFNKILTVTNVKLDGIDLSNSNGKYLVFFNLDDVTNHVVKTITVDLEWINDEDNREDVLSSEADFIDVSFKLIQYYGQNLDGVQ